MTEQITKSPEETMRLAGEFAKKLKPGDVLGLIGELGAGKTCFIQGLAAALHVNEKCYVSSPTFTIMKIYPADIEMYHFDFYRLEDPGEFIDLGFEDYMNCGGIAVIEWADKFMNLLPEKTIKINFEVVGEGVRRITF